MAGARSAYVAKCLYILLAYISGEIIGELLERVQLYVEWWLVDISIGFISICCYDTL